MTHDPQTPVPQSILDAWDVPEMPADMKERVMTQVQEPWRMVAVAEPTPRGRGTLAIATFTAVAALAASVAAVVIGLHAADRDVSHSPLRGDWARPEAPSPPPSVMVGGVTDPAPTGHLTIATDPPDSICEVDGVVVPGPSPFVITGLTPGPHAVVVRREGLEGWARTIEVPVGQLHVPVQLQAGPSVDEIDVADAAPGDPLADPFGASPARAEVRGKLDRDVIRRVVRRHIDEVRGCYNPGLARDPSLAGRVALQFTIGPTGSVTTAVVKSSTLSDAAVGECIARAMMRWTFPAPEGGGNVVVTYPFVLEPG